MRAAGPGLAGGHRRADPEDARLVGRGGHHAAPADPADDDRLAAQRRLVALLHGGEERVQVDVEDRRVGAHAPMMPRDRRRRQAGSVHQPRRAGPVVHRPATGPAGGVRRRGEGRCHDRPCPPSAPRGPADLLALVPGFLGFHPERLRRPAHLRRRADSRSTPASTCPTDPVGLEELTDYLARVAAPARRPDRWRSSSTPTTPGWPSTSSTTSRAGWSRAASTCSARSGPTAERWWALGRRRRGTRHAVRPGAAPADRAGRASTGTVVLAQPPRAGRQPVAPTRPAPRRSQASPGGRPRSGAAGVGDAARAPGRRGPLGRAPGAPRTRATGCRLDARRRRPAARPAARSPSSCATSPGPR